MIANLQALRAAAALLIISAHLDFLFQYVCIPPFGGGGVDLFFVISGFIMVHATRHQPPTAGEFLRNRVARIVPMYWFMTLSIYCGVLIVPHFFASTTDDPIQLLKSLLFIPFLKSNGLIHPVLFVGWTLNLEVFFYLLFSIGLICRHYFFGIFSVILVILTLAGLGPYLLPPGVLTDFYTDPRMVEFTFGMVVGLLMDKAPTRAGTYVKSITALSMICLPIMVLAPVVWPETSSLITAGLPSALLVAGSVLLDGWGWSIRNAFAMELGNASYVLYLSHPYVVGVVLQLKGRVQAGGATMAVLVLCAAFLSAILIAFVLHRALELPLSRFAHVLLSGKRRKPQPA